MTIECSNLTCQTIILHDPIQSTDGGYAHPKRGALFSIDHPFCQDCINIIIRNTCQKCGEDLSSLREKNALYISPDQLAKEVEEAQQRIRITDESAQVSVAIQSSAAEALQQEVSNDPDDDRGDVCCGVVLFIIFVTIITLVATEVIKNPRPPGT